MNDRSGSLEYWAERAPDRIALSDERGAMTFGAWNRMADSLAESLAETGLGENDVIATRMKPRREWAVVHAAAGKLGLALMVVNWRLTADETAFLIRDSGARMLFDDAGAAEAPPPTCRIVDLAGDPDAFGALTSRSAPPRQTAREADLIVYTSGTTGRPKGVRVTGGATPAGARDGESSVVLITMPLHHSSGPHQLIRARAAGARTILMGRFDPERLLQIIDREKVTAWRGVPTMFRRLSALPEPVLARYDVGSVRSIGIGAAASGPALKRWAAGFFRSASLTENYGCTEAGMISGISGAEIDARPESVGKPLPGVSVSIRDANGRPLPPGVPGNIWVLTPRRFEAYLDRVRLGADQLDEQGYFMVGDVGLLDEDGYLFITDRAKDMIVAGGVNIYPAEIELVLREHPRVQDCAVVGAPNPDFGEEVAAFIEPIGEPEGLEAELREMLSRRLASYKRPQSYFFVDTFPKTSTGKVLKRHLRDRLWAGAQSQLTADEHLRTA